MYRVERRFTLPVGHRLSLHKGRCSSIHGHNLVVLVGVMSEKLNENYMVIDFSHLKAVVDGLLDQLDHCLMINKTDFKIGEELTKLGMRVMHVDYDPTAEKISEDLYIQIKRTLEKMYRRVQLEYVTVYENENSKATYRE
jgi:6-pyruvoyltetrahydropterin/6-carboxytetrahydropterin synthase